MFRGVSSCALPSTAEWHFAPWPDIPESGFEMEFRLTYEGKLPAQSQSDTRVKEKHLIRRAFGKQLAELWKAHPRLRADLYGRDEQAARNSGFRLEMQRPVQFFERCGRRFLPLISNSTGVGCSLDILFLRRDQPGDLIRSGGDIDNRIKVLFDSFRLPANDAEVFGSAQEDDTPFFCLLEDDRLITEVKVTTDRLLTPIQDGEHINDVRLVIHINTIVIDPSNFAAMGF